MLIAFRWRQMAESVDGLGRGWWVCIEEVYHNVAVRCDGESTVMELCSARIDPPTPRAH